MRRKDPNSNWFNWMKTKRKNANDPKQQQQTSKTKKNLTMLKTTELEFWPPFQYEITK